MMNLRLQNVPRNAVFTRVEMVGGGPADGEILDIPIAWNCIHVQGEDHAEISGRYYRRQHGKGAGFTFDWEPAP